MPECLRVQPVPREDRDILAEGHMAGGLATAQPVVVHRGEVVVDQRVGMDQLDRPRQRQHLATLQPHRLGGGERKHGTDPLAAGQQRVAHRLVQARGQTLLGEAHLLQVALHFGPQVFGIGGCGDRAGVHYSSESWPGARRQHLGARTALELRRSRAVGQRRALVHQRRRRVSGELAGTQLLRGPFQAPDQLIKGVGRVIHEIGAFSRTSRSAAASTPLTNAGASAPQKVFALRTASSIAPSGGIGPPARGVASGCRISISATRRMLRSSGWMRCTDQPCAWRSITSSNSGARSAAA